MVLLISALTACGLGIAGVKLSEREKEKTTTLPTALYALAAALSFFQLLLTEQPADTFPLGFVWYAHWVILTLAGVAIILRIGRMQE